MPWPKINSYKEFDGEKKFLRLENSPPPHNFSNSPSLRKEFNSHRTGLGHKYGHRFIVLGHKYGGHDVM